MDFGVVGLDNGGLVCSDTTGFSASTTLASSDAAETKHKWYGSGFLKQQRSGISTEDDWRDLKVAKTCSDDFSSSTSKPMLFQQKCSLLRSNTNINNSTSNSTNNFLSEAGQQMLSFSSPNSQTVTFPYNHPTSIAFTRNAGYGSGGMSAANMHGVLSGARGPFTPSQWMELEHQALIYKYINANVPIPSYLLTPIRKALDSAGFSSFSGLRSASFGWGAFHLGFSNSTDPEPGRCRRTDGKKWRCSRDAIADHKYCERHMNRGRHRSRKPVEGQSGNLVSGTTNNSTVKLMPVASSTSAVIVPGDSQSNSIGLSSHHQFNNQPPSAVTTQSSAASVAVSRSFLSKENLVERYQDTTGLSTISPAAHLKENQYSISKPQNSYEESSRREFGHVCTDSLLNPLNPSSSLVNCSDYSTSKNLNDRQSKPHQGLHQFMDDWPNSQSERSWSEMDMNSARTKLSISIPMGATDFMSLTSSPTNDKVTASPLRLSRELDATHMGLGVGTTTNERNHKQANWIPISWESSMGGPLGEVLHSSTNNSSSGEGKNTSALNLMTDGWDGSPRLASSPTGVLQKTALVSLANSSAGSSPRAENSKAHEGSSLFCGVLGSTLLNPALPAL